MVEGSTEVINGTNPTGQSTKHATEYVYFAINTIGFALNVFVITVVTHRPFIQSKISRMLVVNQCSTDAVGALLSAIDMSINTNIVVPQNAIGDLICQLWWSDFLLWSFIQASVNGIMLFTIERYLSITRPFFHKRLTSGCIYFAIVLSWIMGFIINIAVALEAERHEINCQSVIIPPTPYAVQGVITILIYIFPLALLVGLYSHMIIVLKRRNQIFYATGRRHYLHEVSRDLTITVAIATTTYTLLFAPETFIYAIHTFGFIKIEGYGWLNRFYTFFVDINFIMNPLVFVVFLRAFRRELHRLYARFSRSRDSTYSSRY